MNIASEARIHYLAAGHYATERLGDSGSGGSPGGAVRDRGGVHRRAESGVITGQFTGTGSCASSIGVKGTSNPAPPSWGGTYGFNGASTGFNQQTLFLGYTSCP